MHSLLKHASKADLCTDPFPYVVIDGALDESLYAALEREYPFEERIDGYSGYANNTRYQISAVDGLRGNRLTPLWKEFVAYHTSAPFLADVCTLFAKPLSTLYPHFSPTQHTGVRFRDEAADVWLDCQPGINSPVNVVSSVKGPHIDHPNELYAGLLYFRDPSDTSTGSELQIYRTLRPPQFYGQRFVRDQYVEEVARVAYAPNRSVLFLNSILSIHGVSPRSRTQYTRRLTNIIGEVDGAPLFEIPQEPTYVSRVRQLVKSLTSR